MTKLKLDEVVRGFDELGTLKELRERAVALMADRSEPSEALFEVIAQDPSLTVKVIAAANAEVSLPSRLIGTVFDAIDAVERKKVLALVESLPSREVLGGFDHAVIDFFDFWINGVCCALLVSALSRRLAIAEPRDVYPLGVLHRIGRALLCLAAPAELAEIRRRPNLAESTMLRAEQSSFGFSQVDVSARLLSARHLPDRIVIPIQYQNEPKRASAHQKECALLHIAAEIAECVRPAWTTSHGFDQALSRLDPFALEITSADEQLLNEVRSEVSISLSYVEHLIDPLPSPASPHLVI